MKKRALKIGGIGSPRGGGDNNNNHLDNDLHSEEEKAMQLLGLQIVKIVLKDHCPRNQKNHIRE